MDPLTSSIVVILGKYALDKGTELGKEVGPKALGTAKEMFGMVLERIKGTDPRTAQKFPDNPGGYKAPLADVLDETLQADPDLAAQLKGMLDSYKEAAQVYAATTGDSYHAEVHGDGAIAQAGSVAAGAGGVAVSGDVEGGIRVGVQGTDKE